MSKKEEADQALCKLFELEYLDTDYLDEASEREREVVRAYIADLEAKLFGAKDEQRHLESVCFQVNQLNHEQAERIAELEAQVKELNEWLREKNEEIHSLVWSGIHD